MVINRKLSVDSLTNIIRSRIATGEYQTNLPTENQLISEFASTRYTVRTALQKLVSDGIIARRAGMGTVVLNGHPQDFPWAIRSVNDLIGENAVNSAILLSAQAVQAPKISRIAEKFDMGATDELYLIERLLAGDHGPFSYSRTYTKKDVGLGISEEDIAKSPIIVLIEQKFRITAQRVRQTVSALNPTEVVRKHLCLTNNIPVLAFERSYFDQDEKLIVYAKIYCRPDRYVQTIDLFREVPSVY